MLEKLVSIVAEQLHVEESRVVPEADFKVSALEEEYDIEIPAEELESLTTVQSVVDYLAGKGIDE